MSSLSDADYRTFNVKAADRKPLLDFMLGALRDTGCRILHHTPSNEAPFRIVFETSAGERIGFVAYAFLANTVSTKNRPADEHRFQVKYGPKTGELQPIWQDPFDLYTTLFLGINLEQGFFVGVDPEMHNPTRFFISIEFKEAEACKIKAEGWHAWERQKRVNGLDEPAEVLVGGSAEHFMRYVQFERTAKGLDQGNRQLLAENPDWFAKPTAAEIVASTDLDPADLHPLARDFELSPEQILDVIASARRLKMAVRGWVAEEKLKQALTTVAGITRCDRLDVEGGPDLLVNFRGGPDISIECKNVSRNLTAAKLPKIDFQRTRASKADPCSRYYAPSDFDVVAACLHAVTTSWEFRFAPTGILVPHARCSGKLANNVTIGTTWTADVAGVLEQVGRGLSA